MEEEEKENAEATIAATAIRQRSNHFWRRRLPPVSTRFLILAHVNTSAFPRKGGKTTPTVAVMMKYKLIVVNVVCLLLFILALLCIINRRKM